MSDAILTLSGNHPAVGAAVAAAPWVGGAALGVGGMALLSRGTRIIPGAISLASSFLSRAPAISAAATRYAAPAIRAAAPVVAASPVGRVAGVGMAAYAGGTLLADAINAVISKIKGQETTLGSAIYDLINYEPKPVKVDPIQVTTTSTVQVGLAAGLVPLGQSSSSTSNKPAGTNTSSIMKTNTGNLWLGAPG